MTGRKQEAHKIEIFFQKAVAVATRAKGMITTLEVEEMGFLLTLA